MDSTASPTQEVGYPPPSKPADSKREALTSYQNAAAKLAELDMAVIETKTAWQDAKAERDRLLAEVATFARQIGSDPLGLLKGRGVAWTGRTRRTKIKEEV